MTSNTTDGDASLLERRSIQSGEKIPNAAIFLKRTALEFLQIIFSTGPGDLNWSKDDTKTEIQISDVHAVDLDALGVRPAIVAIRGPVSWRGMGLGGNSVQHRDMKTGDFLFKDMLTSSVAFSCFSREGIEAEQIAHVVFNSFKFFRPTLQKYGFFTIKSLNIGGESLIEQEGSDDKTYVVPVQVTALIEDRWRLSENTGRTLKQIVIENLMDNC